MSWVATAILGGSLVSAASTAYGASKASSAQQSAAQQAEAAQMAMFQQTQGYLKGYRDLGDYSGTMLKGMLPALTAPINMDQATLEQTPGYQFNKTQGLKAVQNSAAARGLGNSGAALKGAATFATGLADNTYQQQFTNAMQNKKFAYDTLMGPTQLGESAAAGTGSAATATGAGVASALGYGGNAAASGYNALGTAGGQLANGAQTFALYNGLYGKNKGGGAPFGTYSSEG